MSSANLSHVAGYPRSRRSTSKAAVRLSEGAMLKIGTLLVAVTFLFTVAVLGFCDRQSEELASAGIAVEQIFGEAR